MTYPYVRIIDLLFQHHNHHSKGLQGQVMCILLDHPLMVCVGARIQTWAMMGAGSRLLRRSRAVKFSFNESPVKAHCKAVSCMQ